MYASTKKVGRYRINYHSSQYRSTQKSFKVHACARTAKIEHSTNMPRKGLSARTPKGIILECALVSS